MFVKTFFEQLFPLYIIITNLFLFATFFRETNFFNSESVNGLCSAHLLFLAA